MQKQGTGWSKLFITAAWLATIIITYATLAHVGLPYSIYHRLAPLLMRPEIKTYAHLEHIIVFAVLGALFAIAHPRHTIVVCCIVLGGAVFLEILQNLTPDRHARVLDAVEKIAGGAAAIAVVKAVQWIGLRRSRLTRQR
ncbi:VanZ family protein [Bradyrhizobium sp. dw_78]|uniref:VanZ family protein n=1 Tax=Bradyrhizobium sp. dw_78 TaxID=2719793 RepID=UPI001BD64F23|nr:VanZ family protein [Bradyrhizobium sp. dw_78]